VHPGACEILYALAHVKGESDRLKALCEELRGMLELCILQLSMSVSAFAGQDLTRHDILRDEGREVLVIARAALKKTEKP
jgi:hypothetical protein